MVIAINTRNLPDDYPQAHRYFLYEIFKRITGNNPEHEFIFISNQKNNHPFITGTNVKQVLMGPAAMSPLLWKFWLDIKLPSLLKKYKTDVFVSGDGMCSLTAKIPQCLVLQDLSFLQQPSFLKKSYIKFLKKNTSKFLNKANSIVTISDRYKQVISTEYAADASAIEVVYNGVNEMFQPTTGEDNAVIKSNYTEGKEYFLYAGNIDSSNNLVTLLKAFSVFKKRQQTNMKLVFAGKLAKRYESFKQNLKSYKYRNDVVMPEEVAESELTKIIGAAYGLINPSFYQGFVPPVLQAMRCDVPVITATGTSMQEITDGAALYVDANSHTDIADKMMLLYKDENLRNQLIKKGKTIAGNYNWEKSADLLWQSICKAIS